jgi:hypothetical protein
MQSNMQLVERALETGKGVLQLAPTWVPRTFGVPGRRLRLDPDDLYAFGPERGGISERWLASAAQPDNGPATQPDEGLSYIVVGSAKITLRDALAEMGAQLIGQEPIDRFGGWVMFSKLFDLMYPVPFHIHQDDAQVAQFGRRGKPEAYYFPPQYNQVIHGFPYTYFGLHPSTTKAQLVECLRRWDTGEKGDNTILELSRAYRLAPGTGWYVPAKILHAPGSLCTYEPQRASDVLCMFQSLVADFLVVDRGLIWKDIPQNKHGDYAYVVDQLDWDANLTPTFKEQYFRAPKPAYAPAQMEAEGFRENWVTYGNAYFSAKELTILPGRTVTIKDAAAYGTVCVQGYGRFGSYPVSAPALIRFGELTEDEFFVTADAAKAGVTISNLSRYEPLVMLKHFNPGNPDMPQA